MSEKGRGGAGGGRAGGGGAGGGGAPLEDRKDPDGLRRDQKDSDGLGGGRTEDLVAPRGPLSRRHQCSSACNHQHAITSSRHVAHSVDAIRRRASSGR